MGSLKANHVSRWRHTSVPQRIFRWTFWSIIVLGPIAVLVFLRINRPDEPLYHYPFVHLILVLATSLVVLTIAIVINRATPQLRDPRALFLGLALVSIGLLFAIHGVLASQILVPSDRDWMQIFPRLSIFAYSIFLVLSSVAWPGTLKSWISDQQQRIRTSVVTICAILFGIAMSTELLDKYPLGLQTAISDPILLDTISLATLAMLIYVIGRYLVINLNQFNFLAAGLLGSAVFYFYSAISFMLSAAWELIWWEAHVLVLIGSTIALLGFALETQRSRTVWGTLGRLFLHDSVAQLERGYNDIVVPLIRAVEAKDPYIKGHAQRVAELSLLIAQHLGLSTQQQRAVHQAAILHDIGKIHIPDSILRKRGPLTSEEFERIKQHPVYGYQMVQDIESLQDEALAILYHHERIDGSGYPEGLRGEEIPILARIIAVADVYDAMTSARSYRGAWSHSETLELLRKEAGTILDADCIEAITHILPIWIQAQSESAQQAA